MIVKLLTEHHFAFLSLKAAEARRDLHMSKCHIVGNLMHWLILNEIGNREILAKIDNSFSAKISYARN